MADLVYESAGREMDGACAADSLGTGPGSLRRVEPPRYPDVLVFGPEGPDPLRQLPCDDWGPARQCPCGAGWIGNAGRCWCCGRRG